MTDKLQVLAVEQPDFIYFECQECGFDSVQPADYKGSEECPLCAGDSGHSVIMPQRTARDTDDPEGFDARKGPRKDQEKAHEAAKRK